MKSHKKMDLFSLFLIIMAYLIFAISLLAVNIVRYPIIKGGLYILLIISGMLIFYGLHDYYKGINNKN